MLDRVRALMDEPAWQVLEDRLFAESLVDGATVADACPFAVVRHARQLVPLGFDVVVSAKALLIYLKAGGLSGPTEILEDAIRQFEDYCANLPPVEGEA